MADRKNRSVEEVVDLARLASRMQIVQNFPVHMNAAYREKPYREFGPAASTRAP